MSQLIFYSLIFDRLGCILTNRIVNPTTIAIIIRELNGNSGIVLFTVEFVTEVELVTGTGRVVEPKDSCVFISKFTTPARLVSGRVPSAPVPITAITRCVSGVVPFNTKVLSSSPTGATKDGLPLS